MDQPYTLWNAFLKRSVRLPSCLPASLLVAFWIGFLTSPELTLGSAPQQRSTPCSKTFQHTPSSASDGGPVSNVSLQQDGALHGVVVDLQGVPVSQTTVIVCNRGRKIAETKCDAAGCFTVPRLAGGIYEVVAASGGGVFRVSVVPNTREHHRHSINR